MRRSGAIVLSAVALAAVLLVVGFAVRKSGPPEGAQSAALAYAQSTMLARQLAAGQWPITIQRLVRASRPGSFTSSMSKLSYADSVYYRTSYGLASANVIGVRPIPYPPEDVWCALLSNDTTIIVALHQDLYNADWIVHEPVDVSLTVERLGCKLR